MAQRWPWLAVLVLFGVHIWLAGALPPADDELYYWCWSQELQPSYYDHPPMTAYLIRLSTDLFGDTLWAVRLPACLCTLGSLLLLIRLVQPISLFAVMLAMPLYTFGAILITPDAPLLFFWTAYLTWLIAVHQTERPSWRLWLIGGVLLGMGILSKYTMGLGLLTAGFSLIVTRPVRQWALGFVLHMIIAFIVTMPILIFNIQRDFAPLIFQWDHAMRTVTPTIKHFPEFVGVQVLLVGILPFVLVPWAIRHRREWWADPRIRVCAIMFVLPFVFFLFKAARGRLEGNWGLVSYIGFWPFAAYALSRLSLTQRRWGYSTFAVPAFVSLLAAVHLSMPLSPLPAKADRLSKLKSKYVTMNHLGETLRAMPDRPLVFAPSYQLTAHLRFQGLEAEQIPGITRESHFTQPPRHLEDQQEALVVVEGPLPPVLLIGFGPPEHLGEFPVQVRDHLVTKYHLFRLSKHTVAQRPPVQ